MQDRLISITAEEEPVPKDLLKLIEDGTLLTKSENDSIK